MKAKGFTLLEIVVVLAISGFILLILGGIFLDEARFFAIQDATSETLINGFKAMDTVGLLVSPAKQVVASATINGATYYTSSTGTLVLRIPSIDASGALIGNTYDYAAVGLDPSVAGRFMYDLQTGAGSVRLGGKFVKASLVDQVIFRYNTVNSASATAIDFYIRTKKNARGRDILTPLGKIFFLGSGS